jgi:hypothetical protein
MLTIDSVSFAELPPGEGGDGVAYAFALEHGQGEAYNENAFQYFMEIERKRCMPSNRPLLLVLIEPKPSAGARARLNRAGVAKFFSTVSSAVRETDLIGWYREGRVAGVVLTQHDESDPKRTMDVVRARLTSALEKHYRGDARGVHVRVQQLSPHVARAD